MFETGHELLDRVLACRRRAATATAEELQLLAEFAALDKENIDSEHTHVEVAAVLRVSKRYARARLALAENLTTRLPATLAALRTGAIDEYKAYRLAEATKDLSAERVHEVEAHIVPHAHEWTPRQLNDRLRRTVDRIDPAAAAARAAAQSAARHVRHSTLDDGAGQLRIRGDVERTQKAHIRLITIARRFKTAGDDRTLDQIKTDVALDCLTGKNVEHADVPVRRTTPVMAALGVDEPPARPAGYEWLPAPRGMGMAATEDATSRRALTDQPLDADCQTDHLLAGLRDHLSVIYPLYTSFNCDCPCPAHQGEHNDLPTFAGAPTDHEDARPARRTHRLGRIRIRWRADNLASKRLARLMERNHQSNRKAEP